MSNPVSHSSIDAGDERHFHRSSKITLGVILLFFVLSLAGAAAQYVLPNDGCLVDTTNFDTPVIQACIGGWPTPLRPGDRLRQFAGMPTALDATHIPMSLLLCAAAVFALRPRSHAAQLLLVASAARGICCQRDSYHSLLASR